MAIIGTLLIACILTAIYVTLTERLTILNIVVGFVIAVVALLLTRWLLIGESYNDSFTLTGFYIVYIVYLFFIIFKSAFVSLGYIFSKNVGVSLIRYATNLKSDNLKSMLANAITLTPGTVTADIKGDTIEVMKLCVLRKLDHPTETHLGGDPGNQTTGFRRIEKVLSHMDREGAA